MGNDYLMGFVTIGGDMGAKIKSVQYGLITIEAGNTEGAAAIDNVDVTKTVLIHLGIDAFVSVAINADSLFTRITLANATTVTGLRIGTGAELYVSFVAVEFDGGIKAIQQGIIEMPGQWGTAVIDDVDTSKTIILPCGFTQDHDSAPENQHFPRITLTDATTVSAERSYSAGTTFVGFNALEFIL